VVPLPNALTGRDVPTGASVPSDWVTALSLESHWIGNDAVAKRREAEMSEDDIQGLEDSLALVEWIIASSDKDAKPIPRFR
jgi:hypothetical protein